MAFENKKMRYRKLQLLLALNISLSHIVSNVIHPAGYHCSRNTLQIYTA